MKKLEREIVIIGAGPAGLCASIKAREAGAEVMLVDENSRPGGQLFKQIHKFFGSADHYAGTRGYDIAIDMCKQAESLGVELWLDTIAYGIFEEGVGLVKGNENYMVKAEKIIVAAGGNEDPVAFTGSTLPGVITAGTAQSLVNLHRTLPGKKIVVLGSGNVGLIVAHQLMQGGAEIQAVIEKKDHICGYGIHAAKLRCAGVPIITSATVTKAIGKSCLEAVEIAKLTYNGTVTEKKQQIDCDTLCLAVGMSPLTELLWQSHVKFDYDQTLGGFIPVYDGKMETSKEGIYVAGDVTGIDEVHIAMEEGSIAGISAAETTGHISKQNADKQRGELQLRINMLKV